MELGGSAALVGDGLAGLEEAASHQDTRGGSERGGGVPSANLEGANLSGTILCGANLMETDLTRTQLQTAHVDGETVLPAHLLERTDADS